MRRVFLLIALLLVSLDAAAWTRIVNFNNGTLGTTAQGSNGFDQCAGDTVYTRDQTHDGSNAVKMSISAGDTGWCTWGGLLDFPGNLKQGDQLWVSLYMYVPSSFVVTDSNGSLKFLRIHTNGVGYYDFQIIDDDTSMNYVYRSLKEGVAVWHYIGDRSKLSSLFPRDRWFKLEINLSFDSTSVKNGGTGRTRVWIDDKPIYEGNDERTLAAASDIADQLFVFTWWNGGAPKSQSLYMDDIYMTSDTPPNVDSLGHPFIGPANGTTGSPPAAPTGISVVPN